MEKTKALLTSGLAKLKINLSVEEIEKLLSFLTLLNKWNRHFNLTAIVTPEKLISHHLLDSLSVAPFIKGDYILDVGSGAGFPGIPLAILFPDKKWTLLDSNGKKTRFLTQAKAELALSNVEVIQARMESLQPERLYNVILTRAVGEIKKIVQQTAHCLAASGCWLFMKSSYQNESLESFSPSPIVHNLQVPGIQDKRFIIELESQLNLPINN